MPQSKKPSFHYSDVIMSAMASQITSVSIVYSFVFFRPIRKHQSSASLACVRGIHRWPVNSSHKGPVTRKMFPFDDVIIYDCGLSLFPADGCLENTSAEWQPQTSPKIPEWVGSIRTLVLVLLSVMCPMTKWRLMIIHGVSSMHWMTWLRKRVSYLILIHIESQTSCKRRIFMVFF